MKGRVGAVLLTVAAVGVLTCSGARAATYVSGGGTGIYRAGEVGPYQVEAELSFESRSMQDTEMTTIGVGALYTFAPVDPGTGPLNESLFLNRVPAAGLMVGFTSLEMDIGTLVELDGMQFGVRGGFADKGVPVSVDLEYTAVTLDGEFMGANETVDLSTLALKAGYFVMPSLNVGLSYGVETMKEKVEGFGTVMEIDITGIGVVGKWVQNLGGGTAVNVEFGYTSLTQKVEGVPGEQTGSEIVLGGDYYFNQLVGVGAGVELLMGDEDNDDATTVELRAKWNLSTSLGAAVSYAIRTYEADVDDRTTLGISLIGRF